MKKVKLIAITMGDPGGIGPEIIIKALTSPDIKKILNSRKYNIRFVILGSPEIFFENARNMKKRVTFDILSCIERNSLSKRAINILDLNDDPSEVFIGKVALANAALSFHALEVGAYMAQQGIVDAIVTGPINKEAVRLMSPEFTGHTEYLARIAKTKKYAMMLAGGPLRVVVVTTHVALNTVALRITKEKIISKIELTNTFLKHKMKIRNPRIGVAALNPHAGEGGKIGREEIDSIIPAIKRVQKKGIRVFGPMPADIIFHQAYGGKLDAIIAMYHDQGLGPLKMIALHSGVNITLNLPFVRTSPDHGTAFDIAYQNKAHPGSMIEAIKTAVQLI